MRLLVATITFAVTLGVLFLFENYKTPPQEQNYAKIVSELGQSNTPAPTTTPAKTPNKTNRPTTTPVTKPSPSPTPSPSTTPAIHIYYTSSSAQAKYYYCDTDTGWKSLSKANLKQFSSSEELLKSYPNRTLHEPCKN